MAEIVKKINEKEFLHIVSLINRAKEKALLSVNVELINLYWNIGDYISNKIKNADWGQSVVKDLSDYISKKHNFSESDRIFMQEMRDFRNRISYEGFMVTVEYIELNIKTINRIIAILSKLLSVNLL